MDARTTAIEWHLRLRNGGADDWQRFAHWLAEDEANARAYDAVVVLDGDLSEPLFPRLRGAVPTAPAAFPARARRSLGRRAAMIAIFAAIFTLVAFLWQPGVQSPRRSVQIATAQGEHRTVKFADGSTATLNGNSQLQLASLSSREAELVRGEAVFDIRHNPRRPFVLALGDDRIEDLGTRFNVVRDGQVVRVEVASGAVRYRRGDNGLQLRAGQSLDVSATGDAIVGHKPPSAVASWRGGQLVYEGSPVAEVAQDIARNLGVPVAVEPALALQPFTGSVQIGGQADAVVGQFATTLSAHARKTRDGWLIVPDANLSR